MMRVLTQKVNWQILLSFIVLAVLILTSAFASSLVSDEPTAMNLRQRLEEPFAMDGSWANPLGTDAIGRDILTRILYGGRVSLVIGGISAALGLVVGVVLGVVAGYMRGWIDEIITYLVDMQLSLPFILLAVAVALVFGNSLAVLVGLAALATWPLYTRVCRGIVLSLREREFVIAARAAGAGDFHIMREHLLPNLIAPTLVIATLSMGRIILLESGLSFLGIGVQPPTPSWGNMIGEGREYLASAWWVATMPGIALMLLTMAVGTIGDWLRDRMDVSVS